MIDEKRIAAVVGGGPAGLMAAEVLAASGAAVHVFDTMPSVGRKFLLAGIGGMNITHSEPFEAFCSRYRSASDPDSTRMREMLAAFGPGALRRWIHDLGIETFVGSSGRVFPREMKAAPLLRRWLHRLRESGVAIHTRHRWKGWVERGELLFDANGKRETFMPDVTVLALGGASWPRLGSDASWVPFLQGKGVRVESLMPSNCGFEVAWSEYLRERHAGEPVKPVAISFEDVHGKRCSRRGEFLLTENGIEGSLVYALSAPLRERLSRDGETVIELDLAPDRDLCSLKDALNKPRKGRSLAEHLRRATRISGVRAALLRESGEMPANAEAIAQRIKALPITLIGTRPIDEAISTAGGVSYRCLDERMMLRGLPGVFCAGEMLDWEAPTGGYLLTACFASGYAAGTGAVRWLEERPSVCIQQTGD